jgi:hypothetical protein
MDCHQNTDLPCLSICCLLMKQAVTPINSMMVQVEVLPPGLQTFSQWKAYTSVYFPLAETETETFSIC